MNAGTSFSIMLVVLGAELLFIQFFLYFLCLLKAQKAPEVVLLLWDVFSRRVLRGVIWKLLECSLQLLQ